MTKQHPLLEDLKAAEKIGKKARKHQRKARPINCATCTMTENEIVVVVPDVLGKNEAHVLSQIGEGEKRHASRSLSGVTKNYRASVEAGAAPLRKGGAGLQCLITSGAWRLEVIGVWPEERHAIKGNKIGFVCPNGDADAAIPQALDALQHAGILDDDARVVEVRAWNLYRRGVRATVMRLVREGDLAHRDMDISHLLPLVPPAVEPPAKPARSRRKVKS